MENIFDCKPLIKGNSTKQWKSMLGYKQTRPTNADAKPTKTQPTAGPQ
jgi:hypothetical protein